MPLASQYIVGQICARGGSKGVPRKNLRPLGGRPLIAWSIECALRCPSLDRVIVSTEDEEIAAVARECGAEVPFVRPAQLAQDNSPEWNVWQHTVRTLESANGQRPDILVTLPPTAPLRDVDDVEACIDMLIKKDSADACITVKPAERNPYFNMVTITDGTTGPVIESTEVISRRQDAPEMFDVTTVAYAARSEFVLQANHLFEGEVCAVIVPQERALDIDTEFDFAVAEMMLEKKADGRLVRSG